MITRPTSPASRSTSPLCKPGRTGYIWGDVRAQGHNHNLSVRHYSYTLPGTSPAPDPTPTRSQIAGRRGRRCLLGFAFFLLRRAVVLGVVVVAPRDEEADEDAHGSRCSRAPRPLFGAAAIQEPAGTGTTHACKHTQVIGSRCTPGWGAGWGADALSRITTSQAG